MNDLTTPEITLLRCLHKTAIVLVLMLRLNKPTGEKELSMILDINQETVRKYLHSLEGMKLVERFGKKNGYIPTQLAARLIVKTSENSAESALSPLTTTVNNIDRNNKELTAVIIKNEDNAENPRYLQNLNIMGQYGIMENKRTKTLADKPWMRPSYIRAHAAELKRNKNGSYNPGMLIVALEGGRAPATQLSLGFSKRAWCKTCKEETTFSESLDSATFELRCVECLEPLDGEDDNVTE